MAGWGSSGDGPLLQAAGVSLAAKLQANRGRLCHSIAVPPADPQPANLPDLHRARRLITPHRPKQPANLMDKPAPCWDQVNAFLDRGYRNPFQVLDLAADGRSVEPGIDRR